MGTFWSFAAITILGGLWVYSCAYLLIVPGRLYQSQARAANQNKPAGILYNLYSWVPHSYA